MLIQHTEIIIPVSPRRICDPAEIQGHVQTCKTGDRHVEVLHLSVSTPKATYFLLAQIAFDFMAGNNSSIKLFLQHLTLHV